MQCDPSSWQTIFMVYFPPPKLRTVENLELNFRWCGEQALQFFYFLLNDLESWFAKDWYFRRISLSRIIRLEGRLPPQQQRKSDSLNHRPILKFFLNNHHALSEDLIFDTISNPPPPSANNHCNMQYEARENSFRYFFSLEPLFVYFVLDVYSPPSTLPLPRPSSWVKGGFNHLLDFHPRRRASLTPKTQQASEMAKKRAEEQTAMQRCAPLCAPSLEFGTLTTFPVARQKY